MIERERGQWGFWVALALAGVAVGVMLHVAACATQPTRAQQCREQCDREHPGQGWRGPYTPPTAAWQRCVDSCRLTPPT